MKAKMRAADALRLLDTLDASLLGLLPLREFQATERASVDIDVQRHAREFVSAAKELELFFVEVRHAHQPTRADALRQEIAELEANLRVKDELIQKYTVAVGQWQRQQESVKSALQQHLRAT